MLISNVFLNEKGNGPKVEFRKSWNAACRKVGLGYGYKIGKKKASRKMGAQTTGQSNPA